MAQKNGALRMMSDILTNEEVDADEKRRVSERGMGFDPLGLLRPIKLKYRLLTKEEALELGRRIQENNDPEARNLLILHNIRLALSMAWRYQTSEMEFMDRVQEAFIGLITAVDKFDYKMGYSFTTYAHWWIRQAMSRALQDTRSMIREPVHIQEMRSRVRRASEGLAMELKRPPTPQEIATQLNIDVKQVEQSLKKLKIPIVSFDTNVRGKSDTSSNLTVGDLIKDDRFLDPLQMVEAREELQSACATMEELVDALYSHEDITDRNKQIFVQYYGLDRSFQGRTLEVVGEQFKVTRERVRQIVASIWTKLDLAGLDLDHDRLVNNAKRMQLLETLTHQEVSME